MASSSSRMLTLLSLLQARRDWSGAALADRLEVSTRTVRRDVDRLRDLGYAIAAAKGPDGGYRLAAGADLPPLLFDDEQAIAIAIALQTATASGVAIGEAAERALASIEQVLPSRLRHRMRAVDLGDPHALGGHDRAARAGAVHPQVLEAVSAAVRERRRLRFDDADRDPDGDGGDGARATRPRAEVEPHGVVARGGRWYLVGWAVAEQRWQVHRLDRIRPVTPAGARFERREIPTGSAAGLVAARAKGSTDVDAWPCVGRVVIELPLADVARWLGDAEAEAIAADRTRVRVGSWSWTGLIAWLLRFDAPFVVEHPPQLAERARRLADRLTSAGPA